MPAGRRLPYSYEGGQIMNKLTVLLILCAAFVALAVIDTVNKINKKKD